MENALGEPQTIALFGGTSEIGLAIVRRMITPSCRKIVLACRDTAAGSAAGASLGVPVDVVAFDAAATGEHEAVVEEVARRCGDVDVAVLAFALLGDQAELDTMPTRAAEVAQVNYVGTVGIGTALANALRRQGHGRLVVVSSVAAERVRRANYVYGSSKAGMDAFALGLGEALRGTGVSVTVVRPGWVATKMTAGRPPAPFATTADAVAEATWRGMRRNARLVWVPAVLRPVFSVMRHLPQAVFRRLPEPGHPVVQRSQRR
jgi:decaprenylphospho-beta-D-erythro-pentofuranosid-2-ulose 2-reductase